MYNQLNSSYLSLFVDFRIVWRNVPLGVSRDVRCGSVVASTSRLFKQETDIPEWVSVYPITLLTFVMFSLSSENVSDFFLFVWFERGLPS